MQNLQPIEKDLFSNNIPEDLVYISQTLRESGFEVYLVGGAVRDLILSGGYSHADLNDSDFDFTTSAAPQDVQKLFRKNGKSRIFTIPTGINHGTVTVVIDKGDKSFHYEVTTFRIEGEYLDGRHPSNVQFAPSLKEDLSRRDFTINSMAYDILDKKLYDPFDGLKDIENKLIRTVGDPYERFEEDGLRPIRACRIAAQLNFNIEDRTFDAVKNSRHVVNKVSMERVHDELLKLMKSEKPSAGIEYMREGGLMVLFIPELLEGYSVPQNEFHKHDVYYHNILSCDAAPRTKPLVRIAALFHDIGKLYISRKIIKKTDKLTENEFKDIRSHSILGSRLLLKHVDTLGMLPVVVAFEHHMRQDAKSYPKLSFPYTPHIISAIISICDVYDALAQRRSYKADYPPDVIYNLMNKEKDRFLQPQLVSKFFSIMGVWPVGTAVTLNGGRVAIVREENLEKPFLPKVEVMYPSSEKGFIDLSLSQENNQIESFVNPLRQGKGFLNMV
jgi:tRNA nucleotidyltransferase/poly(A) polymerase